MQQYFNWKTYFAIIALAIVGASLYYTSQLAQKLAEDEKKKVQAVAKAIKTLITSNNSQEITFATYIIEQNTTIPLIILDEKGNIFDHRNIDSTHSLNPGHVVQDKLAEFKKIHPPIEANFGTGKNYIYYGESYLLIQLRYYPYVQLAIIILFLVVVLMALASAHRSLQNQVWVGLSKETAHQLGTPLSSIEAWLELLRENDDNNEAVIEMQKDLDRLKLVADRFGKVGSAPKLEQENLVARLQSMVEYMQKRAPQKVIITLHHKEDEILVNISGPLLDWVIENLLRNALDSMGGKGRIDITVTDQVQQVWIDVQDNGKGIPGHQVKKVFIPGYTTKKRGVGAGVITFTAYCGAVPPWFHICKALRSGEGYYV